MKINYIRTKKDNDEILKTLYKGNKEIFEYSKYHIFMAKITAKLILKDPTGKREVELLDDKMIDRMEGLKDYIINYDDITFIRYIEDVLFIYEKKVISIPFKAFSNEEEKNNFINILKSKCSLDHEEEFKNRKIGVLKDKRKIEELPEEEKNNLVLKGHCNKKRYITLLNRYRYSDNEIRYKRLINLLIFCAAGILFMPMAVGMIEERALLATGFAMFMWLGLTYVVNSLLYSEKRVLAKKLKGQLNHEVETEFLIGDSQILYKINGEEKLYSFDKVKKLERNKDKITINVEEKDNTIFPIIINLVTIPTKDRIEALVDTLEERLSGLEEVKEARIEAKLMKRKLIVSLIAAYIPTCIFVFLLEVHLRMLLS